MGAEYIVTEGSQASGIKSFGISAVFFSILAWVTVIAVYTNTFGFSVIESHERWGQFGDFIGGVLNPTFGLLSFLALLYTLYYQSKELSLSTKALEEQGNQLNIQAFESTLFSMLSMCRERIEKMQFESESMTGDRALRKMYGNLKSIYEADEILYEDEEHSVLINKSYERFIDQNDIYIGSYFRLLDSLFKFVETSTLNDKRKYWEIVRAQMTHYELLLVFYSSWASADFLGQEILDGHRFFQYTPCELLLSPELHSSKINRDVRGQL